MSTTRNHHRGQGQIRRQQGSRCHEHQRRNAQRHRDAAGFAKNAMERSTAEGLTRKVDGVKSVKNEIAVRP
jgi:hypothetical protein